MLVLLVQLCRDYPEEFIGRNALVHQDDVESTLTSLQKIATDKG
jgi:hypothetical protein